MVLRADALNPLFRSANKQEIIKAYRKLAQQWHPDNFQSEVEKKEAEKRFIDIASAKEVLTDPGQGQIFLLPLESFICNVLACFSFSRFSFQK